MAGMAAQVSSGQAGRKSLALVLAETQLEFSSK